MTKIPVGVLGATGMVGQQYLALLANHPWFEVKYIAASPRSAGKTYGEALTGRRHFPDVSCAENLIVQDANDLAAAEQAHSEGRCSFVFSALEMGREEIKALEGSYAAAGIPVISNASAHRSTKDVPMVIGEVNPEHLDIIPAQQKNRGWKNGFIVVKPNCSIQSYMTPLWALIEAGFEVKRLIVTTLQAVSGAGYPGVASLDILDNVIPFIGGEEEKSESEPLKILGEISGGEILNAVGPRISAHCTRVPVSDGHTVCVSLEFGAKKPGIDEIKQIFAKFRGLPQNLGLPSAPVPAIVVSDEPARPQPRLDRSAGGGMAITVGRIRPCPVFDVRFVGLSHNTIRGAAGGGVLNAELLREKGYLG
jgi:aspartate-semialdehyde dehydrogenase